jgi:hypothetical protein
MEEARKALPSGSAMARCAFGKSRAAAVILKPGEEPLLVKLTASPTEITEAAQSEDEAALDKALFAPVAGFC